MLLLSGNGYCYIAAPVFNLLIIGQRVDITVDDKKSLEKRHCTHTGFSPTENRPYHVKLPDEVLLEHLPGICGMTHVFKTLCRICTCLLQQNLLTSRMLKTQIG